MKWSLQGLWSLNQWHLHLHHHRHQSLFLIRPWSRPFATNAVNTTEEAGDTYTSSDSKTKTPSIFEEFIQKSTYPSRAINLLEQQKDEISTGKQRQLLELVTKSKNRKLLERAQWLEWKDPNCQHLLIAGWAQLPPGTGAAQAARLLQAWSNTLPPPDPPPTLVSYCVVLTALAQTDNHQLAGQALQKLCKSGVVPDRDCFHRVLGACAKAGATGAASNCFTIMGELHHSQGWKTQPNLSTYKLVLIAHSHPKQHRLPDAGQAAYKIFQSMPETPDNTYDNRTLNACYNLTLNALANEGFRTKFKQRPLWSSSSMMVMVAVVTSNWSLLKVFEGFWRFLMFSEV
jgi:hypothetical protein